MADGRTCQAMDEMLPIIGQDEKEKPVPRIFDDCVDDAMNEVGAWPAIDLFSQMGASPGAGARGR
jgi:hypothetical protein